MELCLGPKLSSTLPSNKGKMLYNHITIHILMIATKKERTFEFLVPLQVLYFITRNTVRCNTNKKPLLWKKDNVQKYYCGSDFAKTKL